MESEKYNPFCQERVNIHDDVLLIDQSSALTESPLIRNRSHIRATCISKDSFQ